MSEEIPMTGMPKLPPLAHANRLADYGVYTRLDEILKKMDEYPFVSATSYGIGPVMHPHLKRIIVGLRLGEVPFVHFNRKVEMRFLRQLHAKVFLFYEHGDMIRPVHCIVGSINTYRDSDWVECAVDVDEQYKMRRLQKLFDHLWEQSIPFQRLESSVTKE